MRAIAQAKDITMDIVTNELTLHIPAGLMGHADADGIVRIVLPPDIFTQWIRIMTKTVGCDRCGVPLGEEEKEKDKTVGARVGKVTPCSK